MARIRSRAWRPATYVVREVTPSGYVRTAPTLSDHYTINLAANRFGGQRLCQRRVVRLLLAVQRLLDH